MIDLLAFIFVLIILGKVVKAIYNAVTKRPEPPPLPRTWQHRTPIPEPTTKEAAEQWVEKNRPPGGQPFFTEPLTLAELDELDDMFN